MLVRVVWAKTTDNGSKTYQVLSCDEYQVVDIKVPPYCKYLKLDDGDKELRLVAGDTAFIMNNEGKTIDIVRTYK